MSYDFSPLVAQARRERNANPPQVLYHYCSAKSAVAIVESRKLWAGNATHMNDSLELLYAQEVVVRVAERLLSSAPNARAKEFLASLISKSVQFFRFGEVFVSCFSEHPDQLSQWRAYADDGLGFAIGLRSSGRFRGHLFGDHYLEAELERVIYDPAEQEALVEPAIVSALQTLEQVDDHLSDPEGEIHAALLELMVCLKHPAFYEEKEWRLVVRCSLSDYVPAFKFLPSRFGVSPYLELAHHIDPSPPSAADAEDGRPKLPIVHVVAGPKVMRGLTATYLLMTCNGYWSRHEALEDALTHPGGVFVSESAASYR